MTVRHLPLPKRDSARDCLFIFITLPIIFLKNTLTVAISL